MTQIRGGAHERLARSEYGTMAKDVFEVWSASADVRGAVQCEGLHDDCGGLRILLKGENPEGRTVEITFEHVIGYRNINESYRFRTWSARSGAVAPLVVVRNSSWIDWLREEAAGVLDEVPLTHYAIFTLEDCVDIVSESQPVLPQSEPDGPSAVL